MATTIELLTILQEQFKGWNQDGPRGLLHYLDLAHFMLRTGEAEQLIYYNEPAGKLPYLTTTAADFDYALPSTIWKLQSVLVEVGVTGSLLDDLTGTDYGLRQSTYRRIEYVTMAGIDYLRVPYIRSWPATETAAARLMFTDDPGSTSSIYNYAGYRMPARITSDSVQIEVEPPWDELYLLPAVCKLLEGVQHGNYIDARKEILGVIKPAYWDELNSGEQGFDYEADDRGF